MRNHRLLSRSHDGCAPAIKQGGKRAESARYGEAMPILRRMEESIVKEYDCVLCLFCLSGREKEAVESINRRGCGRALFPLKTKRYRGKNEWLREKAPVLPGYVFVYLTEAEAAHIGSFKELPQVIRIVLPPVSNETINLVKDTSLIYILAMNDLLRVARTIVQREFDMTPFLIAGIFYLAMTFVLTWMFKRLEAYYGKYDK